MVTKQRLVTIQWNAVSTEVRINVKCHRGLNQRNVTSDKIIEVRSNGMEVRSNRMKERSNGMKVRSNGMKVRSNGMEVRSNGIKVRSSGMKVRSNGMEVRSNGMEVRPNGMKVAIRLYFCPQCPSIVLRKWFVISTPCQLTIPFFWPVQFFNDFSFIDLKRRPYHKLLINILARNYLDDEKLFSLVRKVIYNGIILKTF